MSMKQLSVFVENKVGRLSAVLDVLKDNYVDISALSLADTSEYGILRLVVDKPDIALDALKASGVMVKCTEVIAAAMDDAPGGLAELLSVLSDANVGIEYMYAFIGKEAGKAWTVLRVDDVEAATDVFTKNGIAIHDDYENYRK
ncbi:MAG: acetolactate synthase [Clostridia bacterium]|nr:acetolactate synthase [Clostridia bacterium]